MTQEERRLYLIKELIKESPTYKDFLIPKDKYQQKALLSDVTPKS